MRLRDYVWTEVDGLDWGAKSKLLLSIGNFFRNAHPLKLQEGFSISKTINIAEEDLICLSSLRESFFSRLRVIFSRHSLDGLETE